MIYRVVKIKGKEVNNYDFHCRRYADALDKYFDIITNKDYHSVKLYEALINDNEICIAQHLIQSEYK